METWWQQAWNSVRADFSDLPDAASFTQTFVRLLLAAIIGGVLGYDTLLGTGFASRSRGTA